MISWTYHCRSPRKLVHSCQEAWLRCSARLVWTECQVLPSVKSSASDHYRTRNSVKNKQMGWRSTVPLDKHTEIRLASIRIHSVTALRCAVQECVQTQPGSHSMEVADIQDVRRALEGLPLHAPLPSIATSVRTGSTADHAPGPGSRLPRQWSIPLRCT
jgi:hypothetical protein